MLAQNIRQSTNNPEDQQLTNVKASGLAKYLEIWFVRKFRVAKDPRITRNRKDVVELDVCFEEVSDCIETRFDLLDIDVYAVELELRDDEEGKAEVDGYMLHLREARAGVEEVSSDGCGELVKVSQTQAEKDAVVRTSRFGETIARCQYEISVGDTGERDEPAQGQAVALL